MGYQLLRPPSHPDLPKARLQTCQAQQVDLEVAAIKAVCSQPPQPSGKNKRKRDSVRKQGLTQQDQPKQDQPKQDQPQAKPEGEEPKQDISLNNCC